MCLCWQDSDGADEEIVVDAASDKPLGIILRDPQTSGGASPPETATDFVCELNARAEAVVEHTMGK